MKQLLTVKVAADWVDYNGHMNDAAYALVFSRGIDAFMEQIGMDAGFRERTKFTIYTLTMLVHYRNEAKLGQEVSVFLHLLDQDAKKLHVWLEMRRGEEVIAFGEQMLACVDQGGEAPKTAPFPPEIAVRLAALFEAQKALPRPALAGKGIGIRRA